MQITKSLLHFNDRYITLSYMVYTDNEPIL